MKIGFVSAILDVNGVLYGTTTGGGASNNVTLFKITNPVQMRRRAGRYQVADCEKELLQPSPSLQAYDSRSATHATNQRDANGLTCEKPASPSDVPALAAAAHFSQMAWINKRPTTTITAQVTP